MMCYKTCSVWIAALLFAVCSCVSPTQELSSYWDNHDFSSVKDFSDIDAAEKKFEGYIDLLNRVSHEVAVAEMESFMDSAAQDTVAYLVWTGWFEAYLHILESPYNNEPLFQAWLSRVISDGIVDDYLMDHLLQIKRVSGLNAAGTPPSDVMLRDADGNDFLISDLKGCRTVLLFFNGGCRSCADYMSETYEEYKRSNTRLVAVLLNASSEMLSSISKTIPEEISSRWTLAWCPGREIEDGHTYDLTLVPSKLLLDKEGIIIRSYHK